MTVSDPSSPRLAALLSSASVEISSRGHQVAELRDHFAAGADVTITFLPGDNYRHNVETAAALRRAGFNPVPHVAAREMASRGITCNALAPGFIETDMTAVLSQQVRVELLRKIPLNVLGQPEDIANAALFLASPAARYITGQVITVDGGMVM